MNEAGLSSREVLELLKDRLKPDLTYSSGSILGSMCTQPHSLARKVFLKYLEKNLGDPGLFKGTVEIEREAVRMLASLMSMPNAPGFIVSGGSEANVLALWSARDRSLKNKVVASSSVHVSIDKAAAMLKLKLVKAPINEVGEVDVDALGRLVDEDTAGIVGVAGTTELGAVDSIEELNEIALSKGVHLHVDAAFGGLILPFLKELSYNIPEFDFKLEGVSSITIDPHKMGMAPIPAGGILFRSEELLEPMKFNLPYLCGGPSFQYTITGTRPGASAIAVWALFKHLGREGYRKVVRRCMKLTELLVSEVERIPKAKLVRRPVMNIVGIRLEGVSSGRLAEKLHERELAVSVVRDFIRVVVMPHLKQDRILRLVKELNRLAQGS